MAHSLEKCATPFLDHRIVEFAATLPLDMKIRGAHLKFILRDLMKDRLPRSVTRRKKEGFDIPVHHWLRTVLRPLLLETLSEANVRASEFSPGKPSRTPFAPTSTAAPTTYNIYGDF